MIQVCLALSLLVLLAGCGADETRSQPEEPRPAPEPAAEAPDEAEDEAEPAAEAPEVEPPPEPARTEPIAVDAAVGIGPVRLGMSREEVVALGLPERAIDPRTQGFGPYEVVFEDDAVTSVAARMGDLERVRLGDRVFEVGAHIHALRDAVGDCRWIEGGGERYRCRDGALAIETTHSLDPALYTIRVTR